MQSPRLAGETDEQFATRADAAARYAKHLVGACLSNTWVTELIEDDRHPFWTRELCIASPTVRVEYEQAIAFGSIGETLYATRSKHWGDGPYIHPLKPDDWFYPERITYRFRETSIYNRRYEQRRRMKELLGKRNRHLVEAAKYHRHTLAVFLQNLSEHDRRVIERVFSVDPQTFRRACRGKTFLDLPPRMTQLVLPFEDERCD